MMPEYVPTGACAGCPYRVNCHEARQRAVDATGIGRHTSCRFYREFDRRSSQGADIRRADDRLRDRLSRFLRARTRDGLHMPAPKGIER